MRVLCITNYYPPSDHGWGYMQLCEEVTDGLSDIGHEIAVLTSTHRAGEEISRPYSVHRLLHLDPDWNCGRSAAWQFLVGRRRRERQSIASLRQMVAEFGPDVIFFWHYIGIPRTLLWEAEQIENVSVAYYLAGYHPELADEYRAYWVAKPSRPIPGLLKRVLAPLALRILNREGKPVDLKFDHVACVSKYVRERLVGQRLISPEAVVVHNGVDMAQFRSATEELPQIAPDGLRCIVAGHLKQDKGVHTAIEALALLRQRTGSSNVTLDIVGGGVPSYIDHLRERVSSLSLQGSVRFRPAVSRGQMPEILARCNILILPSEYDEPLARAMQEAMALGLLVIGTTTGGSGELLAHERTGLVFEPGDPKSLADQLERALSEPASAARLAHTGHRKVIQDFNIQRTVEQIEHFLAGAVKAQASD